MLDQYDALPTDGVTSQPLQRHTPDNVPFPCHSAGSRTRIQAYEPRVQGTSIQWAPGRVYKLANPGFRACLVRFEAVLDHPVVVEDLRQVAATGIRENDNDQFVRKPLSFTKRTNDRHTARTSDQETFFER